MLEHLDNPIEIVERLKNMLAPDGGIYIEVPNADDALLSLYKDEKFADFTYWMCHLYLYNNDNLRKLAKKCGMKIKFIKQVQRYSLANHLYWLSNNKPGGHVKWDFLNDDVLDKRYGDMLANLGIADTIICCLEKA